MYDKLTTEEMTEVVSKINHIDDVFRLLHALEHKFTFVSTMVTRADVEEEYSQAWRYEGGHFGLEMSEEDWEKFSQEWFWRKGASEVFWEDVSTAIRFDLREAGLLPETAVVE
jgi:hypothetical protein